MMYIILLIYFVNIATGDDSSETKYIDLLPEKEKEDFLETVARRIFENIKHKNAIPERDEHTKLIEKVIKEESLNLKRVSQNTSLDSDRKGNVVEGGVDKLDLTQDGKRNKRNSLKDNKNSDIVSVQRASTETNIANFNELSKELGVSDTEDIEVKHTNNKQSKGSNENITTESNVEGIRTEITVEDLISKEGNNEQEGKTTTSPLTTPKSEEIINKEASESIDHSYSTTAKINITSRRNDNPEPTNDLSEKNTKLEPVAITVKTSLSTSPDVKFTTSEEAVENNVTKGLAVTLVNADIKTSKAEDKNVDLAKTITKTVTTSPEIKATETKADFSKINETRKAYDKLASNFETDNMTLVVIRDDRDNEGTTAVIDDKTLITNTVVTDNNIKLNNSYFDDIRTAEAVGNNQNHTYLDELANSIQENYKSVTKKINSVTESENKDMESSETIVNDTDNSNETIINVIKNSKDYIKMKHRIKESALNDGDYNGTTLENNKNSMAQNSNVIVKSEKDVITTTTMDIPIENSKEISIENSSEKTQYIGNGIIGGIPEEVITKSNNKRNGPEIETTTSKEIMIDEHQEIEIKNNTAVIPKINHNKTEAVKEVITENINITIKDDNPTERNKIKSAEIKPDKNLTEKNTMTHVNNEDESETYNETTTVKIETLTVATDINQSQANDKDIKLKKDFKPYINQDKKSITQIPNTDHESVEAFDTDNKKNLEKIENNSANFVNDMIKVIRASFSDKPNQDLKPLRLLNDNPKPKEYTVYKASNNEPLDENLEGKDDNVIKENPYYVPVYNYGPEHAYYNPKNRLGPNADDDDVTIIKNDGNDVESIAHDYDSIVKDNGFYDNDYTKNYQNRQDSNGNDARNDVDYDEAFNKEKEFIDRMGDKRGNIFTNNQKLRSKDTENTHYLKKVEYMKNLVKIYKNRKGKNRNRQKSFTRYKFNLPIVVNYPKYSDIIMNSHDYLDVDYRYPTWKKPKHSRSSKGRLIRTNGNKFPKDIIITSFADDANSDQENIESFANTNSNDQYKDDSNMIPDKTQNQKTERPYKMVYDDDYEEYLKKPFVNHYGKPNSINLFESGEYIWETQDTKQKKNKKKNENEKSLGIKNQIRKLREMMYSSANFGFIKPKEVDKNKYHRLKDFIKEAPKKCDGEDPSCIEPFILINQNHMVKTKHTDSGRHAMNNSIASDFFLSRTNNASDSVDDYTPKLSAKTKDFKFDSSMKSIARQHFQIRWITDFSEITDQFDKFDCSFCNNNVCHTCMCGSLHKFCKITPVQKPTDKNDIPTDYTEPTENPADEEHTDTTVAAWSYDTVKNISMLPSYLDPILKRYPAKKERYKKRPTFRSRNDKLPPKTSLRDEDENPEDNTMEINVEKPNIIHFNSPDQFQDADSPTPQAKIETTDPSTHKPPEITPKQKYNKINQIKSIMEIIPDDVELMLKVSDMLENEDSEENESGIKEKESTCLRSVESTDLESYVTVLQDMIRNEAKGLIQYDWMGTSIDIQAAVFKLKEMTESVKNNEILDNLDFKLLKYFTFLHKFSAKRRNDLRMILPKPKYKYNRTSSEKGFYSRTWLKRRLKKFAFEVSGIDLYYFMEFLEELQFYLYDLHTALTQIALVTSYNNQNWFQNLSELYLDNSRKNILELLLHVTTVRLLDLVENSIQTGLQDGFLNYVINNEKETEKSNIEFILILNIIEELKKIH